MSDEFIIHHSSPTLAGVKTGNLFNCPFTDKQELTGSLRSLNRRLRPKGVRIIPMKMLDGKVLLYIYRPDRLKQDFSEDETAKLLEEYGYMADKPGQCVVQLSRRMCTRREFPHEIGLFLSYPPEDVCGFIRNPEEGVKCVGCWKVYGDEAKAREQFAKYEKCKRSCRIQFAAGKSIEQLTVSD